MKATLVVKDDGRGPGAGSTKVRALRALLENSGYRVTQILRSDFRGSPSAQLLVSAGGDGTLLTTARRATDKQVVFGVNTAPGPSVGFLCGATLDTAESMLRGFISGRIRPLNIKCLRVRLSSGGKIISERALNDVLVTCKQPAETFRYRIGIRRANKWKFAEHKSSGIWIATSPGTWAGYRAAGGEPKQLESAAFHWRVREAYKPPHGPVPSLLHGSLGRSATLKIIPNIHGRVFVDGSGRAYSLKPGERLEIKMEDRPIRLLRKGRP